MLCISLCAIISIFYIMVCSFSLYYGYAVYLICMTVYIKIISLCIACTHWIHV